MNVILSYEKVRKVQDCSQNSIPDSSPNNIDNSTPKILADQVFEVLQESIVSGELRPNQRIVEADIAKKLGTSRTPVREALKKLELTGYVAANRSGGLVVADYDAMQIKSLYEIREALECMALELSCPRITEERILRAEDYLIRMSETVRNRNIDQYIDLHGKFHIELYSCCENSRLDSLISIFRYQHFDRLLARMQTQRELQTIMKYHREILEAVRKRMILRATKLLRRHFRYSSKIALRRL